MFSLIFGEVCFNLLELTKIFESVNPLTLAAIASIIPNLPTFYYLESFELYHEARKSIKMTEIVLTIQKRNGHEKNSKKIADSLFKAYIHGTVLSDGNSLDRQDKLDRIVNEEKKNLKNSSNVRNLFLTMIIFTNFLVISEQSSLSYSVFEQFGLHHEELAIRIYLMICLFLIHNQLIRRIPINPRPPKLSHPRLIPFINILLITIILNTILLKTARMVQTQKSGFFLFSFFRIVPPDPHSLFYVGREG